MKVLTCGFIIADLIVADLPTLPFPGYIVWVPKGIRLRIGGHPANISVDLMQMGLEEGDVGIVGVVGDDLGHQGGPIISPRVYHEMIQPYQKELYQYTKKNSFVCLRFDGSIYHLLSDIIDAGVDIINPVQISAKHMGLLRLKKEFGEKLPSGVEGWTLKEYLELAHRKKCQRMLSKTLGFLLQEADSFSQQSTTFSRTCLQKI